ncbi:MAG: methyltransferase domain-containing protein [Bacteroidetes bacterium]|nr:MAG: methyltransferase domain-containing protein [Bacteroidota bacterium]
MAQLDADYWNNRYHKQETGWNIGCASDPIRHWLDAQENKDLNILIPGAGLAYEAEYAWQQGFHHVVVLDYAEKALNEFKKRNPEFPEKQIVKSNYFEHQNKYDVIIEQTFFCALDPKLRDEYVRHTSTLLKNGGKLIGLLFDFPLDQQGPPYGGSREHYEELFGKYFKIEHLEICPRSIKPRSGKEFWIEFTKE